MKLAALDLFLAGAIALFPAEPDTWLESIVTANRLRVSGDIAGAEKQYLAALELARSFGENDTRYGQTLHNLAGVYQIKRDYVRAEELMLQSLAIQKKALGPMHPDVALSMTNLGDLYSDMNRFNDAEKTYRKAISIAEGRPRGEQGQLAIVLSGLGELYFQAGRMESAGVCLRRALPIAERMFGPHHRTTVRLLLFLGNTDYAAGKYSAADRAWTRALSATPDRLTAATLRMNLGELRRFERRFSDSESLLVSAITDFEANGSAGNPLLPTAFNHLALVYAEQGRTAEAEGVYLRALAILEKKADAPLVRKQISITLHNYARLRRQQSRLVDAAALFARALESAETAYGHDHPWLKALLSDYAQALRSLARHREARGLEHRAAGISSYSWRETIDIRELQRKER